MTQVRKDEDSDEMMDFDEEGNNIKSDSYSGSEEFSQDERNKSQGKVELVELPLD
jgi:hypothetical protein